MLVEKSDDISRYLPKQSSSSAIIGKFSTVSWLFLAMRAEIPIAKHRRNIYTFTIASGMVIFCQSFKSGD
jgi:hypothetical protein